MEVNKGIGTGTAAGQVRTEIHQMPWQGASLHLVDAECYFHNAATCPDCGAGMVRLGACFSCASCGYQSCGV